MRYRRRGRPPCKKFIEFFPEIERIVPVPNVGEYITITKEEIEALRLVDLLDLSHEEAAKKMKVSRPTITRLVNSARKKVAECIICKKILIIK